MTGLAESKFKITSFIRQLMLDDKDIKSRVDGKIFPVVAPKNTKGDFILYQRVDYKKERSKMGVALTKCNVTINAISETYNNSQELAYLIDRCLEGTFKDKDNPDFSVSVHLTDSMEDYEDNKYIQILEFEIQ